MRTFLVSAGILAVAVGVMGLAAMRSDIQLTISVVAFCSAALMFGLSHAIGIALRIERCLADGGE